MYKFLTNAFWMFLEKFLRLVIGVVFTGLIAREIGVKDFGVFSLLQSGLLFLSVIIGLGLDNLLINEFVKCDNKRNILISTVFFARIYLSLVLIIVIFLINLLTDWIDSKVDLIVLCAVLVGLPGYSVSTFISYYQSISQSKIVTKINVVCLLISSAIKLYMIIYSATLLNFVISYSVDLIVVLFFFMVRKNEYVIDHIYFSLKELISLLKQGSPILLSSLIVILYTRLDQFMIAKLLGTEEVAIFNVAVRIAESYIFIPSLFVTSFFPLIAKKPRENIRKYFDIVVLSVFTSGGLVIFITPFFIPLLFGKQYINAIPVTNICIISTGFSVIGSAVTNYLITEGLGYIRLYRAVFGLIINFILNILLIPKYGIHGAAYSSLVSQVFAAWISNGFNSRSRSCFFMQTKSILTMGLFSTLKK